MKFISTSILFFSVLLTSASAQTIAAGGNHSVVLCNSGQARSTGSNSKGQLGSGHLLPNSAGVTEGVLNLSTIKEISASDEHTLFLMSDSTVYAVGRNNDGRLGIGTNGSTNVPTKVIGLTGVIAVSAGNFHSLFLKSDGTVWACGDNYYGALGDNSNNSSNIPVQVQGLSGIIDIAAGSYFSVFVRFDGEVWACGYNGEGQLGTKNYTNTNVPVKVLTSGKAVAAGYGHTLVLMTDGTVMATGQNGSGQLGMGGTGAGVNTFLSMGLVNVTDISAGYYHSLFLKADSTVWAVGDNLYGQLGAGSSNSYETFPVQVNIGKTVEISAGYNHSLFLTFENMVYGSGQNADGQLGNGLYGSSSQFLSPTLMNDACSTTGTAKTNNLLTIKLYPNPTSDLITMEGLEDVSSIDVISTLGNVVANQTLNGNTSSFNFDVSTLAAGIYEVKFTDLNGQVSAQTIVVK